jgi:hypothetical protein
MTLFALVCSSEGVNGVINMRNELNLRHAGLVHSYEILRFEMLHNFFSERFEFGVQLVQQSSQPRDEHSNLVYDPHKFIRFGFNGGLNMG